MTTTWPVVLTTRRLTLRPAQPDDQPWLMALHRSPIARSHLGGPVPEEDLLAAMAGPFGQRWGWFVVIDSGSSGDGAGGDSKRVGTVQLDQARGALEVSYLFDPIWWGNGYATEALPVAMGWAADQLGATEVIAVTQVANVNSMNLLHRLGFVGRSRFVEFNADQALLFREVTATARYVRFQSPDINRRGHHPGIFALANGLVRDGRLAVDDHAAWRASNDWFDAAYTDPSTVDPTVYDRATHPVTAAWFRADATALLGRVQFSIDLLHRYGVDVQRIESEDPGQVIYRDRDQIVVVPWSVSRD